MIKLSEPLQIYVLLAVLLAIIIGLFFRKLRAAYLFAGSVVLLMVLNIVSVESFLSNLSNKSIITIFLLIFITSALKLNFNLIYYLDLVFSKIKNPRVFMLGMTSSVAFLSSIVNNTPVVALLIPYVQKWGKEHNVAPSKFLIPLAYSATLGGMITLIGTSTNLVLNGLMTSNGFEGFVFQDFLVLGLLVTLLGVVYFSTIGYNLLPSRQDALENLLQNPRKYIVETQVLEGSSIIGKSVEDAGLRNLHDVFLAEVVRNGQLISPVTPELELEKYDLLYFTGDTERVIDLTQDKRFGLVLHKANKYKLTDQSDIVEALIPITSDLAGKKVRETNFREKYEGAIVAVHRNGEKIGGKIGDVVLQFGDLLLVTTGSKFYQTLKGDKNLYVISTVFKSRTNNKKEKNIFLILASLSLVGIFLGLWGIFLALVIILSSLFLLKLFTLKELKNQLNLELLIILVCSLTLGNTLLETGAAERINAVLFNFLQHQSPFVLSLVIFGITVILTSFVTNIAAVSIMFPLAAALIETMGIPAKPLFLSIAFAASAAFLTPVSYQTNLMVFGPGGYNNRDFLKSGLLLTILYCLICTAYLYNQIA